MTADETTQTAETRPEATEAADKALLDALAAPWRVVLTTRKGRVSASIPELGVLATGPDAASAHAEAMRQREARIREFAAEGLLDLLPRPGTEPEIGRGLFSRLRVFLIKAAIVSALFLGAVNIISGGLRDIGYVLEKKLDSVASWSPEMVEKNRAKAAAVAEKLGPTLRVLAGAIGGTGSGEGQPATPAAAQPASQPAGQAAPKAQDNATANP